MDSDLQQIISKYPKDQRDNLIPMLQDLQDLHGYLPQETIPVLADHLGLPAVKIYSIATYYNEFHFEPKGRYHIQVCGGTGCLIDGSERMVRELRRLLEIEDGEVTKDRMFSLDLVPCLGACHLAPVIGINGVLYGQLTSRRLAELLDKLRNESYG